MKFEPTPYTHLGVTLLLLIDWYFRTTAVMWIDVGWSLGLEEMEK
jgi:hypothetical protein